MNCALDSRVVTQVARVYWTNLDGLPRVHRLDHVLHVRPQISPVSRFEHNHIERRNQILLDQGIRNSDTMAPVND